MKEVFRKIFNKTKETIVYEQKSPDDDEVVASVLGIKKLHNNTELERRKIHNYNIDMVWNRSINDNLKIGDQVKITRGPHIPDELVGKIFTIERFNGESGTQNLYRGQLAVINKNENRLYIKIKYLQLASKSEVDKDKIKEIFNHNSDIEKYFS